MGLDLKKILCAVDLSEASGRVFDYGTALADLFDAHLYVFHSTGATQDQMYARVPEDAEHEQRESADRVLQRIEQFLGGRPRSWEAVIAHGDPVTEVARFAQAEDVDLVVTASYGLSALNRLLMGTVVERLARTLTKPLFVVHASKKKSRPKTTLNCIVVGGGLPFEAGPTGLAFGLAHSCDASLHYLHSVEAPPLDNDTEPYRASYGVSQQAREESLLREITEALPSEARNIAGLKVAVVHGVPGEILVKYSAKHRADLIVVGVRPQGEIGRTLVGSTTEYVLRRASCPVLAVPADFVLNPDQSSQG